MNKYLTILYSTALLVACSTTEDPILPSPTPGDGLVAIAFSPEITDVENATRADGPITLGRDFNVYGYKKLKDGSVQSIFGAALGQNGSYTVKYDSVHGTYDYFIPNSQVIHYWDSAAVNYHFFAYVGATNCTFDEATNKLTFTAETSVENLKNNYFSRTCKREIKDENGDIKDDAYDVVTLKFIQPYCQVRVIFLDVQSNPITPAPDYTFGPTYGRIMTQGNVSISYNVTGEEETVSCEPTTDGVLWIKPTGPDYYLQFPVGAQKYDYQLILNMGDDEKKTVIVPNEYMNWKPNFSYTYYFKMTDSNSFILYDVKVDAWKDGGTYTGTITQW